MRKRSRLFVVAFVIATGGGPAALAQGQPLSATGGGPAALAQGQPLSAATPKCINVNVNVKDGRATASAQCTSGKRRLTVMWSWKNRVVDASSAICSVSPAAGTGKSFALAPAHPYQGTVTFSGRVLMGQRLVRTLTITQKLTPHGYDVCGAPLAVISTSIEASLAICTFTTDHTFVNNVLRLSQVQCPSTFGQCTWHSATTLSYRIPDIAVYGGEIECSNGYTAVPYPVLAGGASGQCRLDLPKVSSFKVSPSWGGLVYWDITMYTKDPMGQVIGWAPYWQSSWYTLNGSQPFCG